MNHSPPPPSSRVIEAVAAAEGIDPTELPARLYEVIDPDALDSLFTSDTIQTGTVTFAFCGYDVTITEEGTVEVEDE